MFFYGNAFLATWNWHQAPKRKPGFRIPSIIFRELAMYFEDGRWPDMLIKPGKWSFSKWADQLRHRKWIQICWFCWYVMLSHSQKYAKAYHTDFPHLIGRFVFAFWWMGPGQAITYCQLPSLKLTVRPWKWMVGRRSSFLFGFRPIYFQGLVLWVSGRVVRGSRVRSLVQCFSHVGCLVSLSNQSQIPCFMSGFQILRI